MLGFIFFIIATYLRNSLSVLNIMLLMGTKYGIQFMLEYYGLTKNIYVLRSAMLIRSISIMYFALRSFYPLKNTYILKTLIFFGVDVVNWRTSIGTTPLIFASSHGHRNMVSILLEAGADIDAVNSLDMTALMFASRRGYSNLVSLLLKAGANVNKRDITGITVLMHASSKGHSNMVSLILEAGADVNAVDNLGKTAVMFASENGYGTVISILLRAGADVNAVSNIGSTVLMFASENGHSAMIPLLLGAGADVNLVNTNGKNAFDLAINNASRQLIRAAQVAIKQILNKDLSLDEASFLTNKNNAELVEQYIKNRSLFILQKIFSGKELIEQDRIFTQDSSYFNLLKDKFDKVSIATSDSVSTKLTQDVMNKIIQFIPVEETLKITPKLIDYSNLKSKIEALRINDINHQKNDIISVESIEPQKQFISDFLVGTLVGTFLVNPAIRFGRDKINDVNNDKTLGEYYQEYLTLDNLNGVIAAFVVPTVTQIAYFYIGIPYIAQSYQFTGIVEQITDLPVAQGVLQVSLIEGMMLAMDGAWVLRTMAYSTVYECE